MKLLKLRPILSNFSIEQSSENFDLFSKSPKFKLALPYFLALCIFKTPFGFPIYTNLFPILIGLVFILKFRKISSIFIPLILMLGLGSLVSLYNQDLKGIARLGQVFCMLGFSSQMMNFKKVDYISFLKTICFIFVIFYLLEGIFGGPFNHSREIFGFSIPRLPGPVGEVNYSAIILSGSSVLLLYLKKYFLFLFSFLLLIFPSSRTALTFSSVGLVLLSIDSIFKNKKFLNLILISLFSILILTPLLVLGIENFASFEVKKTIETVSNGRFYLLVPYVNMGLDNIFGIGYFRGWDNYHIYLEPIKTFVESIRSTQLNEQHNIFIQVFSEFGIPGYLLFSSFLILSFKKILGSSSADRYRKACVFVSILIGYSFLNGLNDMIFYLTIAFCFSDLDSTEKTIST